MPRAVTIDRSIPLRMIVYSVLASLLAARRLLMVTTYGGVTSSVLIGTLAGLLFRHSDGAAVLAYEVPRPKLSLRLPEAERELLRSVFTGLDDVPQIAQLLVAGQFNDIAKGTTLTEENKPLETLFFICAGHLKVTVAGREGRAHGKGQASSEKSLSSPRSQPQRPSLPRIACERSSSRGPNSTSSSAMKPK